PTFLRNAFGRLCRDEAALSDSSRISPEDISSISSWLNLPPLERAQIHTLQTSKFAEVLPKSLFSEDARNFLLPENPSTVEAENYQGTLYRTMKFYKLWKEVFGVLYASDISHFLTFAAPKLPDPLQPPVEVLQLYKQYMLSAAAPMHTISIVPHSLSDEAIELNFNHDFLRHIGAFAQLLEHTMIGTLSFEEAQRILNSLHEVHDTVGLKESFYMRNFKELLAEPPLEENDNSVLPPEELLQKHSERARTHANYRFGEFQQSVSAFRTKRLYRSLDILEAAARVVPDFETYRQTVRSSLLEPSKREAIRVIPAIGVDATMEDIARDRKIEQGTFSSLQTIRQRIACCTTAEDLLYFENEQNEYEDCMTRNAIRDEIEDVIRDSLSLFTTSHDSEEPPEKRSYIELQRELEISRQKLTCFFQGENVDIEKSIDAIVTQECQLPNYLQLLSTFERLETDIHPDSTNSQALITPTHGDVTRVNANSARIIVFAGARYLQETTKPGSNSKFPSLPERRDSQAFAPIWKTLTPNQAILNLSLQEQLNHLIEKLPEMQLLIDQWRLLDIPLGPTGGRCHFHDPIREIQVDLICRFLQLASSGFRMIHNNSAPSIIIPPALSSRELKMTFLTLALQGLLNPFHAELQVGVPGRILPQELIGTLGTTALLGTLIGTRFKPEAFMTDSNNERYTGRRILAYDAYDGTDRKNLELPFMIDFSHSDAFGEVRNVIGRMDRLGARHVDWFSLKDERDITNRDDVDIWHLVGSTMRQVAFGGPMRDAGLRYLKRHHAILQEYNLVETLKADWIYLTEEAAYSTDDEVNRRHFDTAVNPCVDAYFKYKDDACRGMGVVYDVRSNIELLANDAKTVREGIFKDSSWRGEVEAVLQRPEISSPYK
ncbi:MAG: hypothetical protein KDD60_06860, partial [Bdellovibrionales bacterium]|nr:hypothetical protein [Bdellovibrionales bacterium]